MAKYPKMRAKRYRPAGGPSPVTRKPGSGANAESGIFAERARTMSETTPPPTTSHTISDCVATVAVALTSAIDQSR
jgi:hypothetical protein